MSLFGNSRGTVVRDKQAIAKAIGESNTGEEHYFIEKKEEVGKGCFVFFFCLLGPQPVAYGGSWARGPIGAVAAFQGHSQSNATSEPCLRPTAQLMATPDP